MKKMTAILMLAAILLTAFAVSAGAEDEYAWKASAPTGAPALALATLAAEYPDRFTFVNAEAIAAEFAGQTADFLIAPLNAGAKLFKAGKSTYRLGAVVTWGNLYFASRRADFKPEDIAAYGVTLFGENTINASVALYALKQNGIEPAPEKTAYLAGAANTQSLLLEDAEAIVMTAEPALTAARMKAGDITAWAVNDLLKAAGMEGYTQAGLFIRAETLEGHPEAVEAFLALAKEAADRTAGDVQAVAEAAVALEILPNVKVALSAIPNCAIRFVPAAEAREQVEATAGIDLSQFGGAVPADEFYYEGR